MPSVGGQDAGTTHYLETKLGLDLQGGLRIEYQVLPAEGKTPTRDDLNVLRQIIINRVDKSGVAEPQVVIQGDDRVIVEMPGVQNADQIRNLVGTTGRLDFVPLGQTSAVAGQQLPQQTLDTKCDATTTVNCVLFSGDQIAAASIGANQAGQRTVDFTLQSTGKDLFAELHGRPHRRLLRGRARRQGHHRPRDQRGDPQRPGADQPEQHDRRLPAGRRAEPGHDPPVRPAAVPDPGAREHHRQPDARRGVPPPEPRRRPDRDPDGHLLHGRPLPAAGRRRQRRAAVLRARRVRPVPPRSR